MPHDIKPAWERALDEFLVPWKSRRGVVGALATGSYVLGTQTDLSDIDVHIVLAPTVHWRERGNKRVNGVLVEYFANPPQQIERYMQTDHAAGRHADAHMFNIGRIVFDKTGEVGLQRFPDKRLIELILPCFTDHKLSQLETAARYVQDALGGFEIDGWTYRTKLDLT